jgi:hypothetical protein
VLPTRDDYVMNTSEFEDVKAKLEWADRPILRRHPGGGTGSTPVLVRHPTTESQTEGSDGVKLQALSY